ncbi:SAF domain-containing protein [Arcanobacterium canis]
MKILGKSMVPARPRSANPIRAALWRWRFVLLAAVFAITVQSVITAAGGAAPKTIDVVVAARDIESGQLAHKADLTFARIPHELAGPLATSTEEIVGKHLVAPIPKGAPVLREQVLDSQFTKNARPGSVVAAVPLLDSGDLLSVGTRVNLYAPPAQFEKDPAAQRIAHDAVIVGKSVKTHQATLFSKVDNATMFYVSISPEEARVVLGLGARTPLTAVLAVS